MIDEIVSSLMMIVLFAFAYIGIEVAVQAITSWPLWPCMILAAVILYAINDIGYRAYKRG